MVVGAAVAHDADRLHRQEHGEGLPDRVVEAGLADLVEIDRVGLAEDVELLAGDRRPGSGWRGPGPGKGWRPTKASGRPSSRPSAAHLVLEQLAERLDQLHLHPLGQAADIVVRLDRHRRAAERRDALDHVRIERALGEEIGAADLLRLVLEDVDEQPADRSSASPPGRSTPASASRKALARVDMDERDVVVAAEELDDLLRLALAQAARGRRRRR